jgi:hypothetical protein
MKILMFFPLLIGDLMNLDLEVEVTKEKLKEVLYPFKGLKVCVLMGG